MTVKTEQKVIDFWLEKLAEMIWRKLWLEEMEWDDVEPLLSTYGLTDAQCAWVTMKLVDLSTPRRLA